MLKLMTHFSLFTFQQFLLHNYQLHFNAQLAFFFSSLLYVQLFQVVAITIFKKKKDRNGPKKN